jgi:hypothetical protein
VTDFDPQTEAFTTHKIILPENPVKNPAFQLSADFSLKTF